MSTITESCWWGQPDEWPAQLRPSVCGITVTPLPQETQKWIHSGVVICVSLVVTVLSLFALSRAVQVYRFIKDRCTSRLISQRPGEVFVQYGTVQEIGFKRDQLADAFKAKRVVTAEGGEMCWIPADTVKSVPCLSEYAATKHLLGRFTSDTQFAPAETPSVPAEENAAVVKKND